MMRDGWREERNGINVKLQVWWICTMLIQIYIPFFITVLYYNPSNSVGSVGLANAVSFQRVCGCST